MSWLMTWLVNKLGDVVVAPAGQYEGRMQLHIPNTVTEDAVSERRTLADYFWFGRIVSINQRGRTAHIQWFEHASKTLLQEIHDPQELFMTEICDTLELRLIVGKVNARRWDRPLSESERRHLDPLDFFYSFTYNQKTGSFTSMEQVEIPLNELRGNSCDICLKASELDTQDHAQLLGVHGSVAGVALRGTNYHINDFAMVRVVNHNTYPDVVEWLALSPHHFYVTYHFPSVEATDWETRTALTEHNAKRLEVCSLCYTEDRARTSKLKEFLKGRAERPLRTFDPFGGAGTFGLAMEESGCMKLTHAVEITPSAAKTLKENSPDTVVYNQCANVVLQYSIRAEKQGVDKAAHYGVPQARVRFFLVAARLGHPLPELPQPLYHFPLKDSMEIKFPHGLSIRPIDTQDGIAPFNFITIDDAISDLPRFDW
ncbi:hypothetical protein EW026_g3934 [Hermanssonia centrifuga]|uniref:BAH domain-containing protein n=1 Tax=Hermanssonia centrifuga TaxID=98765 RepID=A0A4S4KJS7_9APHY|nr:hypothetical protein EW026_g3934 [Hermanssonia centrifuga]